MNLRRSLALAAATAAIAPAVLLTAPAVHAAEGDPSPSVSETTTTETTTTDEESTPTSEDTTPAAEDTTPSTEDTTPAAEDTMPSTTDTTSPSASSATPSASASAPAGPAECEDGDDLKTDKNLHASLSGLPSKIVAGSGFHNFKLNVKNSGGNAYQRVDLGVFAAQVDEDDFFVDTSFLTLQFRDPSTGKWTGISLDENDEGAGYLGYTDVRAKESFSIDLRLAVAKKAPAGLGFAISIGMYADDKGNCVYSEDGDYYEFDILAAGSKPGDVNDSKPQGGSKPLPNKPSGNTQIDPQGHLAETGSNSTLPVIAVAGGAAIAVGAGAVFVVRRRKPTGSGATV
ncbi:LAETG motif-containing sortase-dependent surface protein [Streptomyces antibioticus]|uniref:LAETG motif-containing sortase-dependent surface protein n=1 Tax=Streptomyces antibioticus TaxID=1890 RepID=UPI0033F9AF89